jgi:hypothetical protein
MPFGSSASLSLQKVVLARFVRNRHLADATYLWAFCTLTQSPGARHYYDTRRANGANHNQALRALGNRLVGVLHGCLRYRQNYSEVTAWGESALPLDIWSRGMSNSGRPSVASWAWRQRALQTEAWVWAINVVVAPINDRRHTLAREIDWVDYNTAILQYLQSMRHECREIAGSKLTRHLAVTT